MTLLEWPDHFGTEVACEEHLFHQRWLDGFVCPQCQGTQYWTIRRSEQTGRSAPLYECTACHHQASVTAGTLFHRTKVSLGVWFLAIFLVAVDKRGQSALALSRELGWHYTTAWRMHHKIQRAMKERNARYPWGGLLALDDSYFGGVSHGARKRGRGTDQDPVIVGVSLTRQEHPRYIFMEAVPDLTNDTVLEVLDRRGEHQGVWRSDGAAAYAAGARAHEADHEVTLSKGPKAPVVFHWVNTIISLAKTFIDGTYHGRGRARRQLYLEEFVYRCNRRPMKTGLAAARLLLACVQSTAHPDAT